MLSAFHPEWGAVAEDSPIHEELCATVFSQLHSWSTPACWGLLPWGASGLAASESRSSSTCPLPPLRTCLSWVGRTGEVICCQHASSVSERRPSIPTRPRRRVNSSGGRSLAGVCRPDVHLLAPSSTVSCKPNLLNDGGVQYQAFCTAAVKHQVFVEGRLQDSRNTHRSPTGTPILRMAASLWPVMMTSAPLFPQRALPAISPGRHDSL